MVPLPATALGSSDRAHPFIFPLPAAALGSREGPGEGSYLLHLRKHRTLALFADNQHQLSLQYYLFIHHFPVLGHGINLVLHALVLLDGIFHC